LVFRGVFLTTEGTEVTEEKFAGLFYSQLSLLYSLWQGCHGPLTPDPSPPFHGGEGRNNSFQSKQGL
jgi:hypothetical protein